MLLAPPRQLSKTFQPTSGNLLARPHSLTELQSKFNRSWKRLSRHKMRGLVVLVTLACFASAQHQALIDYLERRLLAIEVRLTLPSCRALRSSRVPLRGNFQGRGQRQWNADVGKSWGKCWKMQLSEMYRDYGLLVWVRRLGKKCSLKEWLDEI